MDVYKRPLQQVFAGDAQLQAPLFQRPYVWDKERNWKPLWDAVAGLVNRRLDSKGPHPYFMGAVVLDQVPNPIGTMQLRQLIDGQQRLTTLQICLAAIRDIAKEAGLAPYEAAFGQLVRNASPLSNRPEDHLKILPTQADLPDFKAVLDSGGLKGLEKAYGARTKGRHWPRIPSAYSYFRDQTLALLKAQEPSTKEEVLKALFGALQQDLQFVVIELGVDDDAQEIFETLNALGTPLLPADLVRNYLFHRVPEGQALQDYYDKYWKQFDERARTKRGKEIEGFWRTEVRQGRLRRPRLDLFLQYYLVVQLGREVQVTQLFQTYRQLVEEVTRWNPASALGDLKIYADSYQCALEAEPSTAVGRFVTRLEALDVTTVFPVLMELLRQAHNDPDDAAVARACSYLESYLVRRQLLRETTKQYNQVFGEMVKALRASDRQGDTIVLEHLLAENAASSRWPTDRDFRNALVTRPIYLEQVRARQRLLLEAIELKLREKYGEDVALAKKLTVEHIMPQSWEKHWPLEDAETAEERTDLVHRLGNLTLVTKKLNPALSNDPWSKKRGTLGQYSQLRLNAAVVSAQEWDRAAVAARGEALADLAVDIWPRPS